MPSSTLLSLTNAHAIRWRPTLKDVERFRNGSVHEFSTLNALKAVNSDVEKLCNTIQKQNFDSKTNNKQRTIRLTLVLNILILFNGKCWPVVDMELRWFGDVTELNYLNTDRGLEQGTRHTVWKSVVFTQFRIFFG